MYNEKYMFPKICCPWHAEGKGPVQKDNIRDFVVQIEKLIKGKKKTSTCSRGKEVGGVDWKTLSY
jgi:hypothetical protein